MGLYAERLIARLDASSGRWPLADERAVWEDLSLWIAFRENDRDRLKEAADWHNPERPYLVDPLPRKINHAFATLLFGSQPTVTAATTSDQDRLTEIITENKLTSELQRAEIVCSSEGEVWWRAHVDAALADVPLLEWHSRTSVLPLWSGPRLQAAAFVSRYDDLDTGEVFRHFEVHDRGEVRNVLYRAAKEDQLGERVGLERLEDTALLKEEWRHGLPGMLCGRIPNIIGADPTLGISDFDGIEDLLLLLNEAVAISGENARLTAKKRVVVPASVTDEHGNFDASREVLIAEDAGRGLGEGGNEGPFKVLEYSYDAAALIAHKDDLVNTALSRVGIVPQFVGAGSVTEGLAASGTALRVRLLPTTAAADERGQYWDDEEPRALTVLQMLDALPVDSGGFGASWTDPTTPPSIERGSTLPIDQTEEVARHSDAVTAQIESRQTAVEGLHPDWSDEQVAEELARIKEDQPAAINPFGPSDGAPLPDDSQPAVDEFGRSVDDGSTIAA